MELQFSQNEKYFYVPQLVGTHAGWLAVDENNTDHGMTWLPFAFWDVKEGERRTAKSDTDKALVDRYQAVPADLRGVKR